MAPNKLRELAAERPQQLAADIDKLRGKMFVPHNGGQVEVLRSDARFKVLAAGRRWGKTKMAARQIIRKALIPNTVNWWIANTYKNVGRGYREVVRQLPREFLAKEAPVATSNNLVLTLTNGSRIEFYSGESPDALAGEGVSYIVVDEAALIPDIVWSQAIRATLMDTRGGALIISTPRGHNWFWKQYMRGKEGRPGFACWQLPQSFNPYIDPDETAEVKEELPEVLFRQEIMAEFLASGASIFGIGLEREGAVLDTLQEPYGMVFMGVDLAKEEDFTVISAERADGMPIYNETFNGISWPQQRERIHEAHDWLRSQRGVESVTVSLDSTGLGDVVFDDLEDEGLDCLGNKFTNDSKEKMVKLLASDLEKGDAHIMEWERGEFESYAYSVLDSGRYKFEASTGHDDHVSAKLLANWARHHEAPPELRTADIGGPEAAVDTGIPEEHDLTPDTTAEMLLRDGVWDV